MQVLILKTKTNNLVKEYGQKAVADTTSHFSIPFNQKLELVLKFNNSYIANTSKPLFKSTFQCKVRKLT